MGKRTPKRTNQNVIDEEYVDPTTLYSEPYVERTSAISRKVGRFNVGLEYERMCHRLEKIVKAEDVSGYTANDALRAYYGLLDYTSTQLLAYTAYAVMSLSLVPTLNQLMQNAIRATCNYIKGTCTKEKALQQIDDTRQQALKLTIEIYKTDVDITYLYEEQSKQ